MKDVKNRAKWRKAIGLAFMHMLIIGLIVFISDKLNWSIWFRQGLLGIVSIIIIKVAFYPKQH